MQQVVYAFILLRLDYCNVMLVGLPSSTLDPLLQVLNAAMRLIGSLVPRDQTHHGAILAAYQKVHTFQTLSNDVCSSERPVSELHS